MIIGISGKAGSGKDKCADFIAEDFGLKKIALADPIKSILENVFKFSKTQLWGPSQHRNEPDLRYLMPNGEYLTPRIALQTIGEAFCHLYEPIWVDYVFSSIDKRSIISDIRKRIEFDAIKKYGGVIIRIKRPGSGLKGELGDHISESEMDYIKDDEFNDIIVNDGSLDDFRKNINKIMKKYI